MDLISRIGRAIRHRWLDAGDARRSVGEEGLRHLESRVRASEALHTGEIRICIEGGLPLSYVGRDARARERARTLFGKLGVWDTERNNGVLIYLLLADHCIEIVADRGLHQHVPDTVWAALAERMATHFRQGNFVQGLDLAIDEVDSQLRQHFPASAVKPNPNELSDVVVLL